MGRPKWFLLESIVKGHRTVSSDPDDYPRLRRPSSRMESLQCLPWVTTHVGEVHGIRLGIRTDNPEVASQLPDYFPYGWMSSDNPHSVVDRLFSIRQIGKYSVGVYANTRVLYQGPDIPTALHVLQAELKLFIAIRAKHRVFLHAGVVGWNEKAILIPGTTFSGKTTLVSELLRAGAAYYSDEFAVFDRHGKIHPHAAPLEVREMQSIFQVKTPIEAFDGFLGYEPLQVGAILLTQYEPGKQWHPQSLSAGEALLQLLAHAPALRRKPKTVLATLERAVDKARILHGPRGEASATAALLLDRLSEGEW